jgi:RimJ/RimL family protein N-acetyltransferase
MVRHTERFVHGHQAARDVAIDGAPGHVRARRLRHASHGRQAADPFPRRVVDGVSIFYPLYRCPKRILDGCFPKYSLENYENRYPSHLHGRALTLPTKETSMEPVSIVSRRIVLRPLVAGDAQRLYAAVHESRSELGEWLDWCRGEYTQADALAWIERSRTPEVWRETRSFGVFGRGPDGDLIGSVGLSKIDWSASTANLGYWIRTSESGNGFATEAAAAMIEHARTHFGLTRIEIAVHPLNTRSARVAHALGARDEGIVPARIVHRGCPTDAHLFTL